MKKIGRHSHFEAVSVEEMPEFGDRILQTGKKLYCNNRGYSVHICEIDDIPECVVENDKKNRG